MSPLELADNLLDCPHFIDNQTVDEVCFEANLLIRKQHKLILRLSEVLNHINTEMYVDDYGHYNLSRKFNDAMFSSALEATKEYDNNHT